MGSANAQHLTRKRKACPSASLESVAPSRVLALLGVRAAGAVRLRQSKVARAEGKAWELRLGPAPTASKPAPQSQAPRGRLRALSRSEPPGIDTLDSSTLDLCLSLCLCLCLFAWAPFRTTQAAITLHTLPDLRGAIPAFVHISDGCDTHPRDRKSVV